MKTRKKTKEKDKGKNKEKIKMKHIMTKKTNFFFILYFALLALLGSCGHLDDRCMEINWYELGRQDSLKSSSKEQSLSYRREICPLRPDSIYTKAYENGFEAGLREYCNFKTGYIYSLSEMEQDVSACPSHLKQEFATGYEVGSYMKKIQSLQQEIQDKIQELDIKLNEQEGRFSMRTP